MPLKHISNEICYGGPEVKFSWRNFFISRYSVLFVYYKVVLIVVSDIKGGT
jgi:hypothetical protein